MTEERILIIKLKDEEETCITILSLYFVWES